MVISNQREKHEGFVKSVQILKFGTADSEWLQTSIFGKKGKVTKMDHLYTGGGGPFSPQGNKFAEMIPEGQF